MGGCASSKLDDSPALSLCRERCAFLDEAVRQRFALADAHLAYLHSLKSLARSLDRFFSQDSLDPPSSSPSKPAPSDPHHLHTLSHSQSGSDAHLDLGSDDDDDDHDHDDDASASDSLHHHDHDDYDHDHDSPSPLHPHLQQPPYADYFPVYGNLHLSHGGGPTAGGFMNINYMKNQPAPSLLYTQRPPITPETLRMPDSTSYFSNAMYSTANNHNPNPPYPIHNSSNFYNDYSNNYPNYGASGAAAAAGFFATSSAPQPPQYDAGFSSLPGALASTSKAPPPPPPSPPRASAWDFLNPFESFEKYYPTYTPSRDSREVREDEGIPDLEDEEDVVVKEVHGDQKFVDSARSSSYSKPGISEQDPARVVNDGELQYRPRPSVGTETDPVEYEVHMVDKKVVDAEESSKDRGSASGFKPRGGFKGDSEVVREIKVQFERASDSGNELAKFLEVGKLPYKRKHGGHQVSSKILHLPVVSSQPSTSRGPDGNDPASLEIDKELELRSNTLSSTLHKLSLWEKKLCEEVKVEEKMRVLHEQKSRKLKRLDEKGAEHQKVDTTRALVRSLSTKIKIAIQVVDKISVKINNLRDEELWPQLNEFIQGLTRMWKSMLECHHNQCQAITEAKRLDAIAIRKHFSDEHFDATRELEHDLINWTLRFTYWVGAQKGFVRALNDWLMKCLLYVPEETPDGIVPFSPGRIGAPPVFVVCNQWWQSLDRISEKEVVDSMREFASNVLQLWDRDKAEMRQRMLLTKDERKIKSLDKEDQKIQKEMQALDKRMMLISSDNNGMPITGHVVYQSETTKGGNLQASFQHVLEAMERFTASSLKVYEELVQRIEEDHLAGEPEIVS